jgi:hypothetical protein
MSLDVLLVEGLEKEALRAGVEIGEETVKFLLVSCLSALQVLIARGTRDLVVALQPVVVLGLSDKWLLELHLVEPLVLHNAASRRA